MKYFTLLSLLLFVACQNQHQVLITTKKQNTLYLHIENPIDILVTGLPPNNYSVISDNGTILLKNSQYYIIPKRKGNCNIFIKKKKRLVGSSRLYVSDLPKPVLRFFTLKHRGREKSLDDYNRIYVDFEGFIFDVKSTVISFKLLLIRNNIIIDEIFNEGHFFNKNTKTLIKSRNKGDILLFKEIKARLEDGAIITGQDLELKIMKKRSPNKR